MTHWFRGGLVGSPSKVAIFEEPPGSGGNPLDYDASRNGPLKNPKAHLSRLVWHSDFHQYEIAAKQTVSKTHTSLAGRKRYYGVGPDGIINGASSAPSGGIYYQVNGQVRVSTITLLTHNLGYVPIFMVAYSGSRLPGARRVQDQSGGRNRYVTPFATTSVIGLIETAFSTASALSAATRSYEVMCFRTPAPQSSLKPFSYDGTKLILGKGKVDSSKQYLREVLAGESSFDYDRGPTIAYAKGCRRVVTGGVTISDANYSGSFAGPDFIPVGV